MGLYEIVGLLILFVVMVVQVIVPPLPAELIVIGASRYYGIWPTLIAAGSGLFAGGVAVYLIGRFLRGRFSGFFGRKKVALVIERLRSVGLFILLVRVLPYNPSDIISYAAGIIGLEFWRYALITLLVSFVRVWLLAYMGSQVEDMRSLFIIFGLLLLSSLIAWALVLRQKSPVTF